jgi:hypothetical protein
MDLPATVEEARLTSEPVRYCRDVWKSILGGYELSVRSEVPLFAATLALLGDGRWRIRDVLSAAGLPSSVADQHVWRGRLDGSLRRLVGSKEGDVQLQDATFREFLGRDCPEAAENLAERMPELLREGNGEELRAWAVQEGANLALRAAARRPALVRRLLESDWGPLRLQSAASQRRVREMVWELRRLKSALKAEAEENLAVGRLARALLAWEQHIERGGLDGARWWAALGDVRDNPAWVRQYPALRRMEPLLLLPAPRTTEEASGYRTGSHGVTRELTGPACELPPEAGMGRPGEAPGTLLFALKGGGLLVAEYDAIGGRHVISHLFHANLPEVLSLAALDAHRVLALTRDVDGRRDLVEVTVTRGTVRSWGPGETEGAARWGGAPFGVAVLGSLEEQGASPWVVVAAHAGHSILVTVCQGETVQASHKMRLAASEESWRERKVHEVGLVRFAPWTWAVWETATEDENEGWCFSIHRLRREDGPPHIEVVLDADTGKIPLGCPSRICAGKDDCLMYSWLEDSGDRLVAVLSPDGQMVSTVRLPEGQRDFWAALAPESESEEDMLDLDPETVPLVWHDKLGLLFGFFIWVPGADGYFLLMPDPQPSWSFLPPDLERSLPELERYDNFRVQAGWRLTGGRVLLVYPRGGVILAADGRSVTRIGHPEQIWEGPQNDAFRFCFPDGSVIVERKGGWSSSFTRLDGPGVECPLLDGANGPVKDAITWGAGELFSVRICEDRTVFVIFKGGNLSFKQPEDQQWNDVESKDLFRHVPAERPARKPEAPKGLYFIGCVSEYASWERVFDLRCGAGSDWRALVGQLSGSGRGDVFRLRKVRIGLDGTAEAEGEAWDILIRDEEISAAAFVGVDLLAVGYASGRIEVLSIQPGEPEASRCRAVAFTLQRPTDMVLSEGPRGRFLVVLAGEVLWFDLAPLAPSAGERKASAV